jgi:pimeloyl-ACP methyl ester carboxylesterase
MPGDVLPELPERQRLREARHLRGGLEEIRPRRGSFRLSRREVRVSGYPVRYRTAGEGEPLVLLHGLSGSSDWWRRNVPELARRYQVFLLDLPGFGAMRRQRRRFSLAESAAWLLSWAEAVGLERMSLIGHSMGGYVGIKLAAEHPETVDRLVLVAPAGTTGRRSIIRHLPPLLLAAYRSTPSFFPMFVYDTLRMGPATLWRASREILAADVSEELPGISTPTLLVWGEQDPLVPPTAGKLLRSQMPSSRLVVLEGTSHVPMFDRPEKFNETLLSFLAGDEVGD